MFLIISSFCPVYVFQEVDFMVVPSGITYDRSKAVDFTKYSVVQPHSAMYNYPSMEPDILGLVKPFEFQVSLR